MRKAIGKWALVINKQFAKEKIDWLENTWENILFHWWSNKCKLKWWEIFLFIKLAKMQRFSDVLPLDSFLVYLYSSFTFIFFCNSFFDQ